MVKGLTGVVKVSFQVYILSFLFDGYVEIIRARIRVRRYILYKIRLIVSNIVFVLLCEVRLDVMTLIGILKSI